MDELGSSDPSSDRVTVNKLVLDGTSAALKSFVESSAKEIEARFRNAVDYVYSPIVSDPRKQLRGQAAFDILSACRERVLLLLEQQCSQHSIDFWLTFVRRLPVVLPSWPHDWQGYATLAILKWSDWEQDIGTVRGQNQHGVALALDEDDLFGCCQIASLSRILADVNSVSRWVGKGASIRKTGSSFARSETFEVESAVVHYERRRPDSNVFADEGILVSVSLPDTRSSSEGPFYRLDPHAPLNKATLVRQGEVHPINYFLRATPSSRVLDCLVPYAKAIEDTYGTSVDAIMHVLHAFNILVLRTFPVPSSSSELVFDYDPGDREFAHKFGFMIGLCRKGFVRFPEDYLRQSLSSIVIPPHSLSLEMASDHVVNVFERLCLREEERSRIDVGLLQPLPLLYSSPAGQCYVDLLWVDDFVRSMIVRGRESLSSQHGDLFTLALKTHIQRAAPDATIVAHKAEFRHGGIEVEVDLLVAAADVLYIIECKAYSKSREYWLGSPTQTSARTSKIAKAVKQAEAAASMIGALSRLKDSRIPSNHRIEWAVCIPTQEYLKPLERYGMLADGIPRVCTPEELITVLNGKSGNPDAGHGVTPSE